MLSSLIAIVLTALSIGGVLAGGLFAWTGALAIVIATPFAERLMGETTKTDDAKHLSSLSLALAVPLFAAILLVNLWMSSGLKQEPGDLLGMGAALRDLADMDAFGTRDEMGILGFAGMFVSFSLTIGLVCLTRAHELVHRTSSPIAMFAGTALYSFGFDGAYAVEHVYGHHVDVGTAEDPVTARRGETFGRFFQRSTMGQYRNAWRRETKRLEARRLGPWSFRNRVLVGHSMTVGYIALGFGAAGGWGGLLNVLMMLYVKWNSEVSNFVQHYGLVRVPGTPIEPRHSWDCRFALSSIITVNLTRHADHHVHAHRPFWQLVPSDGAPRMPFGFILTQLAATQPRLWQKVVEGPLEDWDARLATEAERRLVSQS